MIKNDSIAIRQSLADIRKKSKCRINGKYWKMVDKLYERVTIVLIKHFTHVLIILYTVEIKLSQNRI